MTSLGEDILEKMERAPKSVSFPLFSALLPQILPITSGMGLRIVALNDDEARVEMPLKRKTRNHVGGVYLGALLIVAEVTMALYVMRRFRPSGYRVLIKGVTSENTAQARGRVSARCRPESETRDALDALASLAPGAKAEVPVTVPVHTVDDDTQVARITFLVAVKRHGPRADVPPAPPA